MPDCKTPMDFGEQVMQTHMNFRTNLGRLRLQTLQALFPDLTRAFSHQCIDKEARLELLRQKGKMWGDDEIRFHLQHMMNHPRNVANSSFSGIPGFVMMDPLLLTTWDSIGPTMCESWCRRNQVVQEKGFHIVAIFLHEEHWFPIWIVPSWQSPRCTCHS